MEDWQRILMVRSLVVSPHEDMRTWLKYASLCGKSGRLVSAPPHTYTQVGGGLGPRGEGASEQCSRCSRASSVWNPCPLLS